MSKYAIGVDDIMKRLKKTEKGGQYDV